MMDRYQEKELLRMTKDELIEHVFYLYKIYDMQWQELSNWNKASENIVELMRKMDFNAND